MKNIILMLTSCLATLSAFSQTDYKIENITIKPIEHATFEINWKGKTFLFDPSVPAEKLRDIPPPQLIFITDIHGDHLNLTTLKGLNLDKATIVASQAVADSLPAELLNKTHVLNNGQSIKLADINIEAIPMYNLPESDSAYHVKGRGNGYVLTLDNRRIYISGDTEDTPEMRDLENIWMAFICMNQPYTMSVEQAAEAVLDFRPKIVFPYHYRGQDGKSDVNQFKQLVNQTDSTITVYTHDWYNGQ
ncbi:MBL fold metallo-hydrolase [Olivibacter sp. SDN3]|uniref:MBL fold metallo-hydrolase n=1 Tax=Olivibacter sp. SDN3 TaxID=2764720 RepID=UPI001650DBF2|nr:MBL fold metallo-hydrolase [Olivibacter sp. SDN3]QNL49368.1 MBL fold metallo-hydrolase [Olivibacter sp. SDN3]